jgi:hypothetical protein
MRRSGGQQLLPHGSLLGPIVENNAFSIDVAFENQTECFGLSLNMKFVCMVVDY